MCKPSFQSGLFVPLTGNSCLREETRNIQYSLQKTRTQAEERGRCNTHPPSDPVASGMTNCPQVGESRDLVWVDAEALLTGPQQIVTARMSFLTDQQSMLAFGCRDVCLSV